MDDELTSHSGDFSFSKLRSKFFRTLGLQLGFCVVLWLPACDRSNWIFSVLRRLREVFLSLSLSLSLSRSLSHSPRSWTREELTRYAISNRRLANPDSFVDHLYRSMPRGGCDSFMQSLPDC
ncbi:hypothetical protein BDV28DRAFT_68140 [Aspergillus coremiiformis]|uniref:Uncharacterized protein n=1 Tax=Aspergillus coremiiformis TaxID=138285 RepID=A0A5N6ZB38_9EURO|nr:hypothetical protein BDV28DRAFT_68140 [Aspergillus coremiiformis]